MTHGYCTYGNIASPEPSYSYLLSPDGRDVFDLASLTKALVTTPLLYALKVDGKLDFSSRLADWLRGDKLADLDRVLQELSVLELLRHQSGLPAWRNFWINHLGVESPDRLNSPQRIKFRTVAALNRAAKDLSSSKAQVYSDVGFILLGLCLERVEGLDLMVQFERFTNSLGVDARNLPLDFGPGLNVKDRSVPTGECKLRRRELYGEVHDENCASLGGIAGHAGLFGTGEALGRFLHLLSRSRAGALLLKENAAARILPVGTSANESLIGWRQGADPSSLPFGDGAAIGHMGFTGVAFWLCPESGQYAILLTNRVLAGRLRPGIASLRREVFSVLGMLRK